MGQFTGESFRKLLWRLSALNFYLCIIMPLLQNWNWKHLDFCRTWKTSCHTPYAAKMSEKGFQPHCELSPHLLSAVQSWFISNFPLISSFIALRKNTVQSTLLPLGHFHLLFCFYIINSHAETGKEYKPRWTGVNINCMRIDSPCIPPLHLHP